MVRYYEQNGVITPKRMEGNNYRVYDIMDYFALGEAISQIQELVSNIKINMIKWNSLKMSWL